MLMYWVQVRQGSQAQAEGTYYCNRVHAKEQANDEANQEATNDETANDETTNDEANDETNDDKTGQTGTCFHRNLSCRYLGINS